MRARSDLAYRGNLRQHGFCELPFEMVARYRPVVDAGVTNYLKSVPVSFGCIAQWHGVASSVCGWLHITAREVVPCLGLIQRHQKNC